MFPISKTNLQIIVCFPKSENKQHELAERTAKVHADIVCQSIQALQCPTEQKLQLLNAIINAETY